MMAYACNPSTWEAETGGLQQTQDSLGNIVSSSLAKAIW